MALKLKLRGDVWQVNGTVTLPNGERRRVRRSTGYSASQKKHAEATLSRILEDVLRDETPNNASKLTVEKVVAFYLKKPGSVGATDQITLSRFAKEFSGRSVTSLRVSEIMEYVHGRGNKPNTVAREINSLNAAFNYARDNGLEISQELQLKRPKVDDARTRWLNTNERDQLISACDERIHRLVIFLFFSGARLGEAFNLKWRDVTDESVLLTTRKGKAKSRRTRKVPLPPRALSAVGEMPPTSSLDDFVFPSIRNSKWQRQHFYPYWKRACQQAGIEDFNPHDCRHTYASILIQKGAGLRQVADLLGHEQITMVMRYSHLAPSHLRDAVAHLEFLRPFDSDTPQAVPKPRAAYSEAVCNALKNNQNSAA